MKTWVGRSGLLFVLFFIVPHAVSAQVANVVFTSDAQTVPTDTVSSTLTIQTQDSTAGSVSLPQTGCLQLETTSASGQFSSSATGWNPVTVLTMNKNTANKNFYYKDAAAGTYTIKVSLALKPETVSASCTNWPTSGWNTEWSATQTITIGGGQTNTSTQAQATSTDTSAGTSSTNTAPAPAPVSSYVAPPVPQLFADAGGDRTVIVGADTQFNGRAYNRQKENVEHVRFLWNFGDGSTADGPTVVHHYAYPGRYAVMLTIAQNLDAVSDRIVVTAEPAKLAFDVPSDGSVAIENHAGRDLDLSGWIVRSTGQLFTLPEGSVILSNETMRIPQKTLKFWSGTQTELDYPNGVVVLRANESSGMVVPAPVSAPSPSPVPSVAPVARAQAAPSGKPAQEDLPEEITAETAPTASPEGQTAAAAAAVSSNGMYWWLGALALSALAGGAVFVVRRIKAGEWDIVEET
ncbi:MAG: PKD domain-containing protein [Patescibacteria group bacterium]